MSRTSPRDRPRCSGVLAPIPQWWPLKLEALRLNQAGILSDDVVQAMRSARTSRTASPKNAYASSVAGCGPAGGTGLLISKSL